jgi:hypothetical protein
MGRVYIITGANEHLVGTLIRYLRRENCRIRGLIPPFIKFKQQHYSHDKATAEPGYKLRDMMETTCDTVHYLQGKEVLLD